VAENGKLSAAELSPIPGGQLAHDAAAAWNANDGPAENGLMPTGSRSSYRLYEDQVYFWNHQPPLAAYPGTSNHGWGKALDLAVEWMRSWIDDHGARFGWKKTEAFSEWWHVNFVGGVGPFKPAFKPLRKGSRGRRVRWYTKRLAFIHPAGVKHGYLRRWYWRYKQPVVEAVRDFQRDQELTVDGVIGEKTAHRISAVFHRQYVARKGKRKRRLRDKLRGRP
jgi:hypothetical protein